MTDLLNRLKEQADRDAAEHWPDEIVALQREAIAHIENLNTVMMAAAVEITAHWNAHCDSDGYGPINLVHRLENGFPAQYGYDAELYVRVERERDQLRAEVERLRDRVAEVEQDLQTASDALGHASREQEQAEPKKCISKNQTGLRPDMVCDNSMCGFLGQCAIKVAPQGQTALLRQALEALENMKNPDFTAVESFEQCEAAINAIKEALK